MIGKKEEAGVEGVNSIKNCICCVESCEERTNGYTEGLCKTTRRKEYELIEEDWAIESRVGVREKNVYVYTTFIGRHILMYVESYM